MNENEKTTETVENENEETVTMTKGELAKKLQGAGDKVRTEYSKKVNELKAKIAELTPAEKSEAELDLERRIAELEAKEKRVALLDSLSENGIDKGFADYFKSDADIKAFAAVYKKAVDDAVQAKVQKDGYVPASHKSGDQLTKEEFAKMNMDERVKLFNENPELYRHLVGRA
jgi:hypothetical protein